MKQLCAWMEQDSSLSVWRRHPGRLTYAMVSSSPLAPQPPRMSNTAAIALLIVAAAKWQPFLADLTRDPVLPVSRHNYEAALPPTVSDGAKRDADSSTDSSKELLSNNVAPAGAALERCEAPPLPSGHDRYTVVTFGR